MADSMADSMVRYGWVWLSMADSMADRMADRMAEYGCFWLLRVDIMTEYG
jgi:hypothetical protein